MNGQAYITTTDTCSECGSKLTNAETSRLEWQGEAARLQKENEQFRSKLRIWPHNEPCYYCKEPVNNLAGNPTLWSLTFCHSDEPGVPKAHHIGCVTDRLSEVEKLKQQLAQSFPTNWEAERRSARLLLRESEAKVAQLEQQLAELKL